MDNKMISTPSLILRDLWTGHPAEWLVSFLRHATMVYVKRHLSSVEKQNSLAQRVQQEVSHGACQFTLATPKGEARVAIPPTSTSSETDLEEFSRCRYKRCSECHNKTSHGTRSTLAEGDEHETREIKMQKALVFQESQVSAQRKLKLILFTDQEIRGENITSLWGWRNLRSQRCYASER